MEMDSILSKSENNDDELKLQHPKNDKSNI